MEMVTDLVSGPVLPATLLLGVMLVWSLFAMLGAVDLDMPGGDMDLGDVDIDVDISPGSIADSMSIVALKWMNLKNVPAIIWIGVFSITWWFISACLWSVLDSKFFDPPGFLWSSILVLRNVIIGVVLTKLFTNPMKAWFVTERLASSSLIGKECKISSMEATPDFGQVKSKTEGAPLLLNVRTDGPHLAQGAQVWITHYDEKNRVYIVSPTSTETADDTNGD